MVQDKGERIAVCEARKHVCHYLRGMRGSSGIRGKVTSASTLDEMFSLLDEILNDGTISIKRNVKEPVTVSKNTNLASCLEVLHGARAHMALVTDRENNFLGIVTMEDIINELMKS